MESQAAEKTLAQKGPSPIPASVVVLRLADFGRQPVTEQARLKGELETVTAKAIEPLAAADRIVLEAPDALAVVVLARPQAALELAERCEAAAGELPLCVGVNHGPVRPANDPLRGAGIVGDGVATGMVLANAATPGRLLASRPFHEALEATSSRRAADLAAAGELTDASVRRHEIFTLKPKTKRPRDRRAFVILALGSLAILALPFLARRFPAGPDMSEAPAPREPAAPGPAAEAPKIAPAAPKAEELKQESKAEEPKREPAPKPRPAAPKHASINFYIKPEGIVYVDGVAKGRTPPLKRIEVSPGKHSIEVRNGEFPPLKLRVNLGRAEEMTVTHSFVAPHPQREGLIPRWRHKLGI
ncbi:MAG TPA: PEGA domain-containing protein [Burkholderiales bacterium]|nr:PEGA domain-containing protein [Burkholderiales bacterium]